MENSNEGYILNPTLLSMGTLFKIKEGYILPLRISSPPPCPGSRCPWILIPSASSQIQIKVSGLGNGLVSHLYIETLSLQMYS